MSRYYSQSWFRHGLLLLALSAGGMMTFFVPTYQEMAARDKSAQPAAAPEARQDTSRSVTETDGEPRHLDHRTTS